MAEGLRDIRVFLEFAVVLVITPTLLGLHSCHFPQTCHRDPQSQLLGCRQAQSESPSPGFLIHFIVCFVLFCFSLSFPRECSGWPMSKLAGQQKPSLGRIGTDDFPISSFILKLTFPWNHIQAWLNHSQPSRSSLQGHLSQGRHMRLQD